MPMACVGLNEIIIEDVTSRLPAPPAIPPLLLWTVPLEQYLLYSTWLVVSYHTIEK